MVTGEGGKLAGVCVFAFFFSASSCLSFYPAKSSQPEYEESRLMRPFWVYGRVRFYVLYCCFLFSLFFLVLFLHDLQCTSRNGLDGETRFYRE